MPDTGPAEARNVAILRRVTRNARAFVEHGHEDGGHSYAGRFDPSADSYPIGVAATRPSRSAPGAPTIAPGVTLAFSV